MIVFPVILFTASFITGPIAQFPTLGIPEGELCNSGDGREWRCRKIGECPNGEGLANGPLASMVCSEGPGGPVVCCPTPPRRPRVNPGSKARAYCERMAGSLCNNSVNGLQFRMGGVDDSMIKNELHTDIAGGTISEAGDHPYMALIGIGETKQWICGGTLISERFVITAAHCTIQSGDLKVVRLGDLDYSTDTEESDPQEVEIAEVIVHPEFKGPAMYHDLALLRLAKEVRFTTFVRPACLNTLPRVPYREVTAAGWGRTGYVDDVSLQLRTVDLSLVNQTTCNTLRKSSTRVPQGINGTIMICAGEEEGIRDTCQGDSGGPLVVDVGQRCLRAQVGVTSFGGICALPNSPGVYTRVSYYVPWIENIVWP